MTDIEPHILVHLPDGTLDGINIGGTRPVVLIGANGAGKTRIGAFLAQKCKYDRIPASRELGISDAPMQTHADARNTRKTYANYQTEIKGRANDGGFIYNELLAEQVSDRLAYAELGRTSNGNPGILNESRLEQAARLWEVLFPGRKVDFGYTPKVRWANNNNSQPYPIREMSDGEQSGLYFVLRIIIANPGVLIVDEPELHLHSLLARKFWDAVEAQRVDCRLLYITHDLSFAISRGGPIGIVQSYKIVRMLDAKETIPNDLLEILLGSATLSVVAKRIVFCEGDNARSLDVQLYGAWFKSGDTVVVPVQSCEALRRTYRSFVEGSFVQNANAVGLVERDYWPDGHLDRIRNEGLFVLCAHELEGMLCLPSIFSAVAKHLGLEDIAERYNAFLSEAKRNFKGLRLQQLVIERAKHEVEVRLVGLANRVYAHDDPGRTKEAFLASVDLKNTIPDAGELFDNQAQAVSEALSGSAEDMIRLVPGKDILERLVFHLGLKSTTDYVRIITKALAQPDNGGDEHLEPLRKSLVEALTPVLPPRAA